MIIHEPIYYEVHFEKRENEIIRDCVQLLLSVAKDIESHGCDTLQWSECGETITLAEIKEWVDKFSKLKYVDTMI